MRASPLLVTAGAAAAWLLLAATAPSGASAAEYYQRTPRDGQGPLPISQWYQTPIVGKSTYYGPYLGGGSCGLDQPDGSAVPPEVSDERLLVWLPSGFGLAYEALGHLD